MLTNGGGERGPSFDLRHDSPASFAKNEAAQLVAQLLDLLRITGCAETFGQLKECLFFLPGGLDAVFDEFDQHTVVAESALLCHGLDLLCDSWGQGNASPDLPQSRSFRVCHWAPVYTTLVHRHRPSVSPPALKADSSLT